jgi:predicted RNA-binding Zn-ribbon protein involved in translation (DUF1610 family)
MDVIEHKCPACGGAVAFDSKTQKMVCQFCDTAFEVEAMKQYDAELQSPAQDRYDWQEYTGNGEWRDAELNTMIAMICPSCGGEIISDKNTAATSCPYCGNSAVNAKQLSGMLRPDIVIPFKLDKERAKKALSEHLNGKVLLPSAFRSQNRIDSITGIYVPFWLFDCDTTANIRYKATKVKHWSDSQYNHTQTDFYSVSRQGAVAFEKVPVDGSSKMDDTIMESIEPFDYKDAVEFQTAYLAGYLADKYDVDAEKAKPRVNERIKRNVETLFAGTVQGYATVMPESSSVQLKQGTVRYALLPIWILNTKYNDKLYCFAMNGQTGKFVGDLPLSWGKFWLWLVGVFAGVSAIGALILNVLVK